MGTVPLPNAVSGVALDVALLCTAAFGIFTTQNVGEQRNRLAVAHRVRAIASLVLVVVHMGFTLAV